jgi:hypothetical protein
VGTADALIAVVQKWHDDGVHEVPAHSNRTIVGQLYGWNGVSWCCEGCSEAAKESKTPCFFTASVAQAIADAKAGRYGLTWISRSAPIFRGDFSAFDWQGRGNPEDFHISTVTDPGTQAKFRTLGCNENDAVTDQWRDRTFVQGFIRPAYDQKPTQQEAPDMAEPGTAVDAVMNDDGTGWVLDRWGGINPVGGAPAATGGPYWKGQDVARRLIVLDRAKPSGYVLDLKGALHPFGGAPAPKQPAPYWP